jgi:photosystem II stability/assembly factor-like uncharacterized protein
MAALKIALAKAARGGTIAAATGGAALLVMACGSAAGAIQAQVQTAARAGMPEGVVVTSVVDLVSPRLGLVGLGASASSTTGGQARLMLTTNFGRTFTSIGPKTAALTEPDSIFFLDRDHGWFATFSVLTLQEKVYRTSDGGRHWQSFAAPGHNLAGGSADSLQFLNRRDGFLTDVVANAPDESLYRTTDGGATWHLIASLPERHHGAGVLPELGQTEFAAGGKVGYLGGGMFSHALYRTSDGGRTWRKADVPAPSGSQFGLPALSGQTQAEPVTIHSGGSASLRTYLSVDDGATWSPRSVLAVPIGACIGPIASDLSHGWAAAVQAHQVLVFRASNQGRSWITFRTHIPTAPGNCGPDQITAPGPSQGWLVVPGPVADGAGTRIYTSADGGKTWRRIDQEALRTV